MADDPDAGDRTEDPTPKRLEDARRDGQVPSSRDVTSFLILGTGLALVSPLAASLFGRLVPPLASLLDHPHLIATDPHALGHLTIDLALTLLGIMAVPLLGFAVAAVLANLVQHGIVVSLKPVTPSLKKISPLAGLKRLFAPKALAELAKNVAKIGLVAAAAWWALQGVLADLPALAAVAPAHALTVAQAWVLRAFGAGLVIVLVVAIADYALQRHSHWENLKMTRQQVRDEHKQSDGDPHVKARIRQIRTERSRQRMMQSVPEATVVITNPTHFAVALRWDAQSMKAPEVTAKGVDALAFRIRAVAREYDVPIVENRPLARALYAEVEVGGTIPRQHFEAVADVIGFVLRRDQAAAT